MTVSEFIESFSCNNEMYVENEDNYRMSFHFNDTESCELVMDWYIPKTDICNCEVIGIKEVYDVGGRLNAITLKVKTGQKDYWAIKEKVVSPLWFYEKVWGIK